MKKAIISILSIAGILVACHSINRDDIIGAYTNHAESAYSIADDTLTITATASETVFTVVRRTAFRRIVNGKPDSLQHQFRRWPATWDTQQKQLMILQTGAIFSFPDRHSLLYGNSVYRKL
jgi:hypothetical protein